MSTKVLAWKPDPRKWNVREVVPKVEADPTFTSTLRNDATRDVRKLMKELQKKALDIFKSVAHLFREKPLVGGDQLERRVDAVAMQTPQDEARRRIAALQSTTTSDYVKGFMEQMTRLSQERATRTAEREEKALNIPMREHPPEQFSFTPKEVLIRETLTNVSTGLITSLQQKYLSDVGRIIETGLVSGASRTEIAQQITDLSSNLMWQSERIVRTETIRAFNTNMRHRLESDGVKYWQWIASAERVEGGVGKAKRTCEVCWSLNGMIVHIGDPFMIHRGNVIRQPPDSHPNCRCTVRVATTRDFDEFHGFKEREPTVTQESVGQLIEMIKKIPRRIA